MIDLNLVLDGKRKFELGDVFKSPFGDNQLFVITDPYWANYHSGIYSANEITAYHKTKILNGEFGITHFFTSVSSLVLMSGDGFCNNDLIQVQGATYKVTDSSQLFFWCKRNSGITGIENRFIEDFGHWAEKIDPNHVFAKISLNDYDADDEFSSTSLSNSQSLDDENRSKGFFEVAKGFFKSMFKRQ